MQPVLSTSNKKPKNPQHQPFKKSNQKSLQINMSTLSTAQKQMCIKLLAQSNLNFQQSAQGFQAQLRIDPTKLTSQFCTQKQQQSPNVSPIKKRCEKQNILPKNLNKPKQNNPSVRNKSNLTAIQPASSHKILPSKSNNIQIQKPHIPHPIYSNSKKPLSKTIKLNNLTQLQIIHPQVQLYIYPKKIPFQSLVQLIQEIYDLYWKQQINGNKGRQDKKQKDFSKNNGRQFIQNSFNNYNDYKQKSKNMQKNNNDHTFCSWIYKSFIASQKQKLKIQQLLVNFIQSLNHFSYKHIGIQIFYNFFSGIYKLDALNYYLVIRTLLQQIYQQKIIEKISNYGSKTGVMYKMKLNPYDKFIQQQKIYDFLEVCCCTSINTSIKQDEEVKRIFNQMTQHMFFDQKKRKNFIHFHQMTEILLKQFTKIQTVNTTNLQLSFTQQGNQTLNDFLFQSQQQILQQSINHQDQELQLTFQVIQNRNFRKQKHCNDQSLNQYLPDQTYEQLLQAQPIHEQQSFQNKLFSQILTKYMSIKKTFSLSLNYKKAGKVQQNMTKSRQLIQVLFESIVKSQKKRWIEYIKSLSLNDFQENQKDRKNKISGQRESQQLLFIQKMQMQYNKLKNCNIVSNQFLKKFFTASFLRQIMIKQTGIIL